MPPRRLPPLNSLRAFEAAARHQSLSRAAKELNVTHAAVSRHVAKLEEFLQTKLFERKHQQVLLTKKGAAYAGRLQSLFDQIQQATLDNFDAYSDQNLLRIVSSPTFAMRLLVPRLARFKQKFPDLKLQVKTYPSTTPIHPEMEADVSIWLGRGGWPDLAWEHLFDEEFVPAGSPSLVTDHDISSVDDLRHFLLLHAQLRPNDWQMWLEAVGATKVDPRSGLHLDTSSLVYQGAINGLGLAMAEPIFMHDDIARGRLVKVRNETFKTGQSYFFVYPGAGAAQAKVRNFAKWLKDEVALIQNGPVKPKSRQSGR